MNLERQALVANGLLVIAGVVLTVMATSRQIGLCWTSFMGLALVFSAMTSYCGWSKFCQY